MLAVDDDNLVLTNTVAMLEDLGHQPISASSAKQALEIMRTGQKVDLIFTDHAMPHMTGAQLAAAVAKEWPDLPLIIATGYAELEPGQGKGKGLPRIAKPFNETQLKEAIDRLIGNNTIIPFRHGKVS